MTMNISQKATLSLDHVLVTVNHYEQALDNYRKMGFSPSPVSYHPWGTVTCFMMFGDNFIELIGVNDASKFGTNAVNGFCFGHQMGAFLDRGEDGVSLIALHSKDACGDYARLVKQHPHQQGLMDFRRKIIMDNGQTDEVVVSIGLLIDPDYPEASAFICQQHRPDLIWVEEWRHHPNGATRIEAVTYMAQDEELAVLESRWRKDYGDRVTWQADMLIADTHSGLLRAVHPDKAADMYDGIALPQSTNTKPHAIAITIGTRDICALADILEINQLPHCCAPGRILVAPEVTGNIILEFIDVSQREVQ
ncbi:VOC family protein [Prodigiosinella aquatilis]|nr:VOC family protein [Prodigiosinella sp. LS101]WJV54396.1 VOC family protein [Prodigiosinella sp. LS101]WJV58757.1 VOC family protein [Pectobacteriaceae bacterium C111]